MTTDSIADADTIVLIHGLWMTPRSWEHWIPRYERRGFRVIAPAYPGFEVEVEALRADPTPIERITVPDTVEHLAGIVSELESPPILIGHSFGGALVQILLDRGLGAAGIAIDSVPTEGVRNAAGVADPGHLPRAAQPGQPPLRGRLHAEAVPVRIHEHAQQGPVGGRL
jgi:pimeloyl-ACP methyl ester carboxylesterase